MIALVFQLSAAFSAAWASVKCQTQKLGPFVLHFVHITNLNGVGVCEVSFPSHGVASPPQKGHSKRFCALVCICNIFPFVATPYPRDVIFGNAKSFSKILWRIAGFPDLNNIYLRQLSSRVPLPNFCSSSASHIRRVFFGCPCIKMGRVNAVPNIASVVYLFPAWQTSISQFIRIAMSITCRWPHPKLSVSIFRVSCADPKPTVFLASLVNFFPKPIFRGALFSVQVALSRTIQSSFFIKRQDDRKLLSAALANLRDLFCLTQSPAFHRAKNPIASVCQKIYFAMLALNGKRHFQSFKIANGKWCVYGNA